MGLLAPSQTLLSADYPTYEINCIARYVRVVTISCTVIGRFQCARDGA